MRLWQTFKKMAAVGSEVLAYVSVFSGVALLVENNQQSEVTDGLSYTIIFDLSLCCVNAGLHFIKHFTSQCPRGNVCERNPVTISHCSNLGPAVTSAIVLGLSPSTMAIVQTAITATSYGLFAVKGKEDSRGNQTTQPETALSEATPML